MTAGRWRKGPGRLWLASLVLIGVVTLAPFEFSADDEIVAMKIARVSPNPFTNTWGRGPVPLAGTLLNVVLFVPFGIGGAGTIAAPHRRLWATVLIVGTLGCALSTAVETAQVFTRYRIPSSTDVLTNTIGAFLGAGAAARRGRTYT